MISHHYDKGLVSPKPSKVKEHFSSEKKQTAEKVPTSVKIVIPMARKSDSKPSQVSHSGIKKQLEAAKNMPFRKKIISVPIN